MFFSCRHADSCGLYKDNSGQQFDPADIVDPSVEDPADFFTYGMTGTIIAQDDAASPHRAKETIRIFNLNNARLTNIRCNIARTVGFFLEGNPSDKQIDEFLRELSACDCPSVYYSLLKRKMA